MTQANPARPRLVGGRFPTHRFPKSKEELVRKARSLAHRVLDVGQRQVNLALGHASSALPEGPIGGLCGVTARLPFTPEQILLGYAQGMFPMDKGGRIGWYHPNPRCVLPLDDLHVPSRIKTYLRKGLFELCFDRNAPAVLAACGDRKETWLTPRLQDAYQRLFEMGAMHTVEAWDGERLVGGMFGVAMGRIYTVESMFSNADHASKLAFAFAAQRLGAAGYSMIDCQYQQEHFQRFGAVEISRDDYRDVVARGAIDPPSFPAGDTAPQQAQPVKAGKASKPKAEGSGKGAPAPNGSGSAEMTADAKPADA
jgi:leucyl/phenylalanyl-tRNA--protein transferase